MIRKKMSTKHSSGFKFKVALAAMKGDRTVSDLCQEFSVASSQIYKWKKALQERGTEIFESQNPNNAHRAEVDKLHGIIGKLKVENDFLERALGSSH